jgi:outer membrane receptor protein involved in Fe transport
MISAIIFTFTPKVGSAVTKQSNVADQTLYNTALFSGPGGAGLSFGNYLVSSTNPYLSAADQATIQASLAAAGQPTDEFYLARANTDLYQGGFSTRNDLARLVGGIDGDFMIGSHKFTWEGNITYGRVKSVSSQPGLVWQNIENAVDAVAGPDGTITCRPGYTNAPIATLSSTCAPLDLFGNGHVSQAALNYITAPAISTQVNKELDAVVDVKGDLIDLPAGSVKVVLGGEIRRESQSFDPGTFFSGEFSQYAVIAPVSGPYYTHEGFGELTIPVISRDMNIPFLESLNLHGAARYTDNSQNGGFWSYTGGGDISPGFGLTIRGNYTRSFREPSVTESFAPVATDFEAGNDPCDARFINGGSNPSVRAANCAAAGVPANFSSAIVSATVAGTGGGNPNLKNEIASSWTVGANFAPTFFRGFSITADYIHIDIADEILQPGIGPIMQACYDAANFPNSPFCADFTRDPTSHQITDFVDSYVNIGTQNYRAAQVSASYVLPLSRIGLPDSAGALDINVNYLHEFKNQYVVGTGSTQFNHDAIGEPADSVTTTVDWRGKKVDWSWTVIYDGPTKVNANSPASDYQYYRVNPYWMANTSIGVNVGDHFTIRAIVNNVFNLGVTQAGPVPEFSTNKEFDAIFGRSFRLSVGVTL